MNTYVVRFKVVPKKEHPRFYEIGGGFLDVFVVEADPPKATQRARQFADVLRWDVHTERGCFTVQIDDDASRRLQHPRLSRLPLRTEEKNGELVEAFEVGISYSLHCYTPGGEDALAAL